MTLVIAEEEANRVIMGADSAAGDRDEIHTYPDLEKIVQRGSYLVGHCGNGLGRPGHRTRANLRNVRKVRYLGYRCERILSEEMRDLNPCYLELD